MSLQKDELAKKGKMIHAQEEEFCFPISTEEDHHVSVYHIGKAAF
jgi:hypothetical protein